MVLVSYKVRNSCVIAMVYGKKWGLMWLIEKVKKRESGVCAAGFLGLGGCAYHCKEGVCLD